METVIKDKESNITKVKVRAVFVVLHYKNIEDTLSCVESLKSLKGDFRVIVVDNGSGNESGERLAEKYQHEEKIYVHLEKNNLGFAKGNNQGCEIAKRKWDPQFYIVINSDVVIDQKDFLERLESVYSKEAFDVLGPKIISGKTGENQNPMKERVYDTFSGILFLTVAYIVKYLFVWIGLQSLLPNKQREQANSREGGAKKQKLHGSALIFNRSYFFSLKECFYPHTFLYGEEDILYLRIQRFGLKAVVSDDLALHHLEDGATDQMFQENRMKLKFLYKHKMYSNFVLLSYYLFGEKGIHKNEV